LLLLSPLFLSVKANGIEIITNVSVGMHELTTSQLRRIYSMRQLLWAENKPIVVFVLPSKNKLHQAFSKEILRMFPYQLDRIWNKLTYSGVGNGPIEVATPQALINAVMRTPGAIGYMAETKINNNNNIHIISITRMGR